MIATALENNGAIVYIVGRRAEMLEAAAEARSVRHVAVFGPHTSLLPTLYLTVLGKQKHGNLIPLQGDVSSKESLKAIADTVKARSGYINLLVNNAGVSLAIQPKLPTPTTANGDITQLQQVLWETETPDSFRKTIDVNVAAVWFGTVAFLELLHEGNKRTLAEGGSGVSSQVLTVSSIASFRKDSNVFSLSYTLSKVAATHLGKMMAHYLKEWKIRSNVICPGLFPSGMPMSSRDISPSLVLMVYTEMVDATMSEETKKSLLATIPMGRPGATDDMAGLVLFLASKVRSA